MWIQLFSPQQEKLQMIDLFWCWFLREVRFMEVELKYIITSQSSNDIRLFCTNEKEKRMTDLIFKAKSTYDDVSIRSLHFFTTKKEVRNFHWRRSKFIMLTEQASITKVKPFNVDTFVFRNHQTNSGLSISSKFFSS